MSWNGRRWLLKRAWLAALLCMAGLVTAPVQAQSLPPAPPEGDYEVLLVTYGPGAEIWERFGHNALWLREPARGLDHAFNFGFFDFEQPNFLRRFVQGRMLYFAAAVPTAQELDWYRQAGRSVRVQSIDLGPLEYAHLRDILLAQVDAANRDYLYDYYYDNCSTRLRDVLNMALDGLLAQQFQDQAEVQTLREHTRRATQVDPVYYLGLEIGLGEPVDRHATRWDEMFLPSVLADSLLEVTRLKGQGLAPLVSSDRVLSEGRLPAMPAEPAVVWPRYLGVGLLLAVLLILLARFAPTALGTGVALAWGLVLATAGLGLLALMLATDHAITRPNINPLLLNPAWVLALIPAWRRFAVMVVVFGVIAVTAIAAWPGGQYVVDVLALVAPVSLVAAAIVWRAPRRAGGESRPATVPGT
ncbi:DUF4105 domain-containing protein [Marinihelvus fidelis]|uniref:DUF4105 domain-containing protein n=1 Tax=Marinihelvus fidelis TaxID=2613842 RepID=A0A5N0TEE8_9GAMM|nr:DUF4105 domain-containing protein [Marinihelvus fidelis]KAA9132467.1 DUF4105 domain-containing protein [Marinihelvus fidelis]